MQRILHRSRAALLAAAWLLTSATPVLAEDIEIYLGAVTASATACGNDADPATPDEYVNCNYPNVLFILDDSGSMDEEVPGTGKSRLANMQDALFNLFSTTNNVNVGMGNFSVPGGPILFPVADINAPLSQVEGAAAATTSYSARISSSTDDAEERLSDNTVFLGNTSLKLLTDPSLATVTVTSSPSALLDDAYERRTNGTNEVIDSPFLMMGNLRMDHGSRQVNASGVRFPGLAVPQGKTITGVVLTLTSNADTQTETTGSTNIRAEDIDNAPAFVAGLPAAGTAGNVTARTRTSASATVTVSNITPWNSDNNIITFEDPVVGTASSTKLAATGLKSVIQEVVDRPGWASGNALALLFGGIDRAAPAAPAESLTGSGRFGAFTTSSATKKPVLSVTYDTGVTVLNQDVGLRFANVNVPQGATITSAYIEMVPITTNASSAAWTILGEDTDDAATYSGTTGEIHGRVTGSPTAATVAWAPGGWTAETAVQTPDLTSIVQEIVSRPGWCGNNSMNFMLTGTNGNRSVYSYEGSSTKAPMLVVNYAAGASGCVNAVLQRQIAISNQDAEETLSDGSLSTSSTTFNINSTQVNGLHFENMAIAPGTTVQEAYLELTAKAANAEAVTATIRTDVGTFPPAAFSGSYNISGRTDSSASVDWTFSSWATGSVYRSPDLKTIIQELVNSPSWLQGYGITLTMTATGSQRQAQTFDGSSANAPRLIVKIQGTAAEKTVRTRLIELSNALTPRTYTPIVGYYSEAARYYKGAPVYWGRDRGGYCPGSCSTSVPYSYPFPSGVTGAISVSMSDSRRYSSLSHFASYTGGTVVRPDAACTGSNPTASACAGEYVSGSPIYRSPILDECQGNYIVLLTDGLPNQNSYVDVNQIESWASTTCASKGSGAAPAGEACGRELANYLFQEDQHSTLDGDQKVITYTIGFGGDVVGNSAETFLRNIATLGGGAFYLASDAASLTTVFQNIISSILSVNSGFEAPALSVNNYNRLTNRDELYYALFKPSIQQQWEGNVKKYKLGEDTSGNAQIEDATGAAAVDGATGFFTETAQSFWSATADGAEVGEGGAASKLTASRNAYTYTGDLGDPPSTLPVSLVQNKYALNESNTANVTTALLGITGFSDTIHQDLLKWAHGADPTSGNAHHQLGDPLHAKPVVVSYVDDPVSNLLDQALLTTNNRGYFSIVDPTDGTEKFTWVPKELLPNLILFQNNTGTVTGNSGKLYGLDGEITLRINDLDGDGDLRDTGDKVYATFGMRRGGRNYYSIDLNRSSTNVYYPNLQWEILGGSGDFAELGQTWSTPKLAKVKWNGTDTEVYFFGGGYDPNQDNVTVRTADGMGRAVYMINAQTGALMWMAGNDSVNGTRLPNLTLNSMDYSIPADVAILDTNGDGYTDRLYVGDMGGQVFRFDFANSTNTGAGNFATGGVIATLAGNAATDNRRFYYAPDIALITQAKTPYLSVALGSGFREKPLSNTDVIDRMYVLRDAHILDTVATAAYTTEYGATGFTNADLYDLTETLDANNATAVAAFENADGWYITMENAGEKVLSKALTFNGFILFSTFDPNLAGTTTNVCSTSLGLGRVYIVGAYDASAVVNFNPLTTGLDKTDRSTTLDRGGIPPEPVIVFRDTGDPDERVDPTLLVGTEVIDTKDDTGQDILASGVAMRKGWWRQDK